MSERDRERENARNGIDTVTSDGRDAGTERREWWPTIGVVRELVPSVRRGRPIGHARATRFPNRSSKRRCGVLQSLPIPRQVRILSKQTVFPVWNVTFVFFAFAFGIISF